MTLDETAQHGDPSLTRTLAIVLLGATVHVPAMGATALQISAVASELGAVLSNAEIAGELSRLLQRNLVVQKGDRYRASSGIVAAFGRLHRCYSGLEADLQNIEHILVGLPD